MRIVVDFSDYKPWSGAVDTYERIEREGKLRELECVLDDVFEDATCSDTELNDLLWYESDTVFHWLGMKTDDEIQEEREARQERRANIQKLLETESAEDFCDLWQTELEQDCHACPLYHSIDCMDDGELIASRNVIQEIAEELLKEIDEEEEENK